LWPDRPPSRGRSILVAGCGTQQAAKYALRYPEDWVTGIDVSPRCLAGTRALKERHSLDNLEIAELRVEDVGALGRTFDLVIATGVLHHLEDPERGLAALREVLRADGALRLMMYAPYGRAGVYLIQEYCQRLGVGTSSGEIRDLAATLVALPPEHPLRPLIDRSRDFATEAGLADALLHPNDRPYSVPQLFAFVDGAGFRFGRWERQAPYLPMCGAPLATPHAERLARLPREQQYAAMELLRGTMVRHSAILYETGGSPRSIDLHGNEWPRYVPIRIPDTICVEEGIPETAAGVLINRAHTYADIYLPIDAAQKRLLERIDGERTIAEIGDDEMGAEPVRTFFQRLWWYDQVAFDTSAAPRTVNASDSSARDGAMKEEAT
jgi:SAM-dependent methyltransferase